MQAAGFKQSASSLSADDASKSFFFESGHNYIVIQYSFVFFIHSFVGLIVLWQFKKCSCLICTGFFYVDSMDS